MTMGGTASFCTIVPSMPSSNKIRSFRENSAENTELFTNICHSPLRTIHPAPNRRYQEVEMGEKYVWLLYRVIKSITIKCPNMPMSSFSRNSIPKPKTCRITLILPCEEARGFKSRIRPPYPQRVVKGD